MSKQGAMSPAGSAAGAALVQSSSKSPAYRNTSAILDIQAVGQQLPGACSSCWGSGSSRTRSGAEEGQCRSRCAAGRQGELTHRLVPGQLGLTAAPSVTVRKKNGSHGIFFCVGLETELRSAKKKKTSPVVQTHRASHLPTSAAVRAQDAQDLSLGSPSTEPG